MGVAPRGWLVALLLLAIVVGACGGGPPATQDGPGATNPPPAGDPPPATDPPPAAVPPPAGGPEPERFDNFDFEMSWFVTPMTERENVGTRYVISCPPGQPPRPPLPGVAPHAGVVGTDVYADASPICYAAVHVGVIHWTDGGDVVFEMRPGQDSYTGSERNGLATLDYGPWDGSFVIISGGP
jgi:hypothetical protein